MKSAIGYMSVTCVNMIEPAFLIDTMIESTIFAVGPLSWSAVVVRVSGAAGMTSFLVNAVSPAAVHARPAVRSDGVQQARLADCAGCFGTLFFSLQDSTKPAGSVKIGTETIAYYLKQSSASIMERKKQRLSGPGPLSSMPMTDAPASAASGRAP